jgi:hypothetical protein
LQEKLKEQQAAIQKATEEAAKKAKEKEDETPWEDEAPAPAPMMPPPIPEMPRIQSAPPTKLAGDAYVRQLKKFKIIDINAIDRAYLMPDEAKIQSVVNTRGKEAENIIKGIEVYFESSIVTKR